MLCGCLTLVCRGARAHPSAAVDLRREEKGPKAKEYSIRNWPENTRPIEVRARSDPVFTRLDIQFHRCLVYSSCYQRLNLTRSNIFEILSPRATDRVRLRIIHFLRATPLPPVHPPHKRSKHASLLLAALTYNLTTIVRVIFIGSHIYPLLNI